MFYSLKRGVMENEQLINNFILNISCLEPLTKHVNKVNIFKILKSERTEIRHSNILAWLLNPNANHGLGDSFLRAFIISFYKENADKIESNELRNWAFIDCANARVYREELIPSNNKKKFLDILVEFDDRVIAIENKIYSKENPNQTQSYRINLEKKFPNHKKILVYLTPLGDSPEDKEWGIMSYSQIKTILESILYDNISNEVKFIVKNYIELIGDDIVGNEEISKLCNDIYKKYQAEFDLIINNIDAPHKDVAVFLKTVLKELSTEEDNILYQENYDAGITYVRFATKWLNMQLGEYEGTQMGIWNNKQKYFYEFCVRELSVGKSSDLSLYLVASTKDIDEECEKKIKSIYKVLNDKNKNTLGEKTCRLYTQKEFIKNAINKIDGEQGNDEYKKEIKDQIKKKTKEIEETIKKQLEKENLLK